MGAAQRRGVVTVGLVTVNCGSGVAMLRRIIFAAYTLCFANHVSLKALGFTPDDLVLLHLLMPCPAVLLFRKWVRVQLETSTKYLALNGPRKCLQQEFSSYSL